MLLKADHDVIVVGAGLSGLLAADLLTQAGLSLLVLEARDRVGGRTLSVPLLSDARTLTDLGGAWTRPHHVQVRQLAQKLGSLSFDQDVEGDGVVDLGTQGYEQQADLAPMTGATRFFDGTQSMSQALLARLPKGSVEVNSPVNTIDVTAQGIEVQLQRPGQAEERWGYSAEGGRSS